VDRYLLEPRQFLPPMELDQSEIKELCNQLDEAAKLAPAEHLLSFDDGNG
jgi:hypothetical protein